MAALKKPYDNIAKHRMFVIFLMLAFILEIINTNCGIIFVGMLILFARFEEKKHVRRR